MKLIPRPKKDGPTLRTALLIVIGMSALLGVASIVHFVALIECAK